MKLERHALSRLALPLKAMVDRFAFATLVVSSIALLVIARAEIGLPGLIGTRVVDVLVPVLTLLSQPVDASRRMTETIGHWFALYEDNQALRKQNRRLLEWQTVARQLALENQALRSALNRDPKAEYPTTVVGRVVADGGSPFVHTVLVDAGSRHGVRRGMAAVNEHGLAGRVIEVGTRSARLLLLTDFNSRVPVMVEPSRDQAILAGDNTREPHLVFLPLNPRLSVGDRVVTSGRGGVLPPGLPVGVVSTIDEERLKVATWVDWDRLDHLRLLDYARVEPPEALARQQREVFGPPPPPELEIPGANHVVLERNPHAPEPAAP